MSLPWDNPPIFGDTQELDTAMDRIREESTEEGSTEGTPTPPAEETPATEVPSGATVQRAAAGAPQGAPELAPALNYAPDARITAMVPAPGWEMLYRDDSGNEAAARLVAWALTDEGVVRGLIVAATGEVVFGDTVQDFLGYNDRGDAADIVTVLDALNATIANIANRPAQGIVPPTSPTRLEHPPIP